MGKVGKDSIEVYKESICVLCTKCEDCNKDIITNRKDYQGRGTIRCREFELKDNK